MLHNDRALFEQLVLLTSDKMGIEPGIVEKDYFVTLFLKTMSELQPDIIFKGGTSLSKCHKIIKRFSEDIDLSLDCEAKPTEGQRKKLKENVISTIGRLGLSLKNPEEIRSRRDFNRYVVDFSSVFTANSIKRHLIVETAVRIRSYPSVIMTASSYIHDFLADSNFSDMIECWELKPFELKVQSAERTFVDKVFAIGDYYLDGRIREHSRHIYDLYKLLKVVTLDDSLRELAKAVKSERQNNKTCLSAQEYVQMNKLLDEIILKDAYKTDYEDVTESLLFEQVDYSKAIEALKTIVNSNIFE